MDSKGNEGEHDEHDEHDEHTHSTESNRLILPSVTNRSDTHLREGKLGHDGSSREDLDTPDRGSGPCTISEEKVLYDLRGESLG